MSLVDELIEAATSVDIEAADRRQAGLRQHFLNVRANAAIAGIVDMAKIVEAEKNSSGEAK